MRREIKLFVKLCSENLPILEPIYEFGSFQVPAQGLYADLRPFFLGKEYFGTDIRNGPGVDIILDLHEIDLPTESVGTVVTLDTIEHVEYTRKAADEMYRILKPNGILLLSSHMKFRIHNFPNDYWRFTPEGFRSLLKPFNSVIVESLGSDKFPDTILGIGFKGVISEKIIRNFRKKLETWKKFENLREEIIKGKKRLKKIHYKFIPPILLQVFRKLNRRK